MATDPLSLATAQIRDLIRRKSRPLSPLEAAFQVSEAMSKEDAEQVLTALIKQELLSVGDADLAQMLAARLGVKVEWSHQDLQGDGEWKPGRGMI